MFFGSNKTYLPDDASADVEQRGSRRAYATAREISQKYIGIFVYFRLMTTDSVLWFTLQESAPRKLREMLTGHMCVRGTPAMPALLYDIGLIFGMHETSRIILCFLFNIIFLEE